MNLDQTKPKDSRQDIRDFLRKAREQQKSQTDENVEMIYHQEGYVASAVISRATDIVVVPDDYLQVRCEQDSIMYVPKQVAFRSTWIKRLMTDSRSQFKENTSGVLEFPDFSGSSIEMIFQWMYQDYILNGNETKRISFQFFIPDEIIMEILYLAHFLEIELLEEFCISFLAKYVDDVPLLDEIPAETVAKVIPRLSPQKLIRLEARQDFKNLRIDTTDYWNERMEERGWTPFDRRYMCSWDDIYLMPNITTVAAANVLPCKDYYAERMFAQEMPGRIEKGDTKAIQQVIANMKEHSSMIREHSFVGNLFVFPISDYIDQLGSLSFLEVVHVGDAEVTSTINTVIAYLRSHPHCKTLRIAHSNLSGLNEQLGALVDNSKINLTSLDLSSDSLNIESLARFLISKNTSIVNLSLASNHLGTPSISSILTALNEFKSLELIDISDNLIKSKAKSMDMIFMSKYKVALLQESIFHRESYKSLMNNLVSITHLDLSNTQIAQPQGPPLCIADNGIKKLMIALETLQPPIVWLRLASNYIREAEYIARFLKSSKTLTSLNLNANDLGPSGFVHLMATPFTPSLKYLFIDNNKIDNVNFVKLQYVLTTIDPHTELELLSIDLNHSLMRSSVDVVIRRIVPNAQVNFNPSAATVTNWKYRGGRGYSAWKVSS